MKKFTLLLFMILALTASIKAQDNCLGVKNIKGNFIEENKVSLSWNNEDRVWFNNPGCDIITHEKAGYNNDCDVSSLHSGLGSLGFNADKDAGFKIMDKFTCNEAFSLRFYLYEGASPSSTINGVYLTIYDGDPLNGGNVIGGDENTNRYERSGITNIYRTTEDNLSDASRPIFYVDADVVAELGDNYEEKTFWYIASFTGTSEDDIHIVPSTKLGETTTGEARIFNEETGWQPMLDENTQTQQGVALYIVGYGSTNGTYTPVDTCNILRNGEVIYQIPQLEDSSSQFYFIDENAPDGINIYGIQNILRTWEECTSDIYTCDVRPSYPPKNAEYYTEKLEDNMIVNRLTWQKEDDMQGENIQTYYEIYRKKTSDNDYTLIKSIAKVDGQDNYEYNDIVAEDTYEYKINTYNIYETGSSESQFVTVETGAGTISINEIDDNINLVVHPIVISNNEIISIESGSEIKDVTMTDMLGRKVNISINKTDNLSCQISINQKCNSGFYLVIVETQKGVCYKKVILNNK